MVEWKCTIEKALYHKITNIHSRQHCSKFSKYFPDLSKGSIIHPLLLLYLDTSAYLSHYAFICLTEIVFYIIKVCSGIFVLCWYESPLQPNQMLCVVNIFPWTYIIEKSSCGFGARISWGDTNRKAAQGSIEYKVLQEINKETEKLKIIL